MLAVAVAREEEVGLMSTTSVLPPGCSSGPTLCSAEGRGERRGSSSAREKKKRRRVVWKLSETRWFIICS